MGMPARLWIIAVCVMAVVAGCSDPGPLPAGPTIVVLQSPDLPDGLSVVSPAVLGLNLALGGSPVDLRVLAADPAGEAARQAAADPSVIGVVVAPFTLAGPAAMTSLASAGVPVMSLSALDDPPVDRARWWRLVPSGRELAVATVDVAVDAVPDGCIIAEPGTWSTLMAARIEKAAHGTGYARANSPEGCDGLIWSGSAAGARVLRDEHVGAMILTDQARTDGFIGTGTAATFGVCGCRDISTSARPGDQAFIHDFQEATGLDPGPYAAEGYDAGMMILHATGAVGATRQGLAQGLASVGPFAGVARRYAWGPDGEPEPPIVRIYQAEGVRWLPAGRAALGRVARTGGET
ncbi:MAG: hypothetical protein WD096_05115 [Actinomycetota bacterium]